jgi:hypothetical protein
LVFLTVLVSAAGAFLSGVGEGDRLGKVGTAFVTSGEGRASVHSKSGEDWNEDGFSIHLLQNCEI